jgi:hypothetical protein
MSKPSPGWELFPALLSLAACSRIERAEAWTIPGPIAQLSIESDAGVVELVAGDELRVERTSGATDATVGWTATAPGVVRIEAHCPAILPCAVNLRITIPPDVATAVSVDTGEVWSSAITDLAVEVDEGLVDLAGVVHAVAQVGSGRIRANLPDGADAKLVVASGDVDVTLDGGAWDLGVVAREQDVAEVPSGGAGRLDVWAPAGRATVARIGSGT